MSAWRAFRSRPLLHDVLLAGALLALGIAALFFDTGEADRRDPDVWAALLTVGMCAPIVLRRYVPVAALAVSTAAMAVHNVADYPSTVGEVSVLVAVYSVAVHAEPRRRRRAAIALTIFLVVFLGAGLLFKEDAELTIGAVIGNAAVFATAYVVGDNVRRRRERLADLEERARRLEHERELEARNAAARERAAIARELHDVVAHSLTLMVVQAAAARRVVSTDAERAERSIRTIEETGRQSLAEMRRILGVLRNGDETPELTPQPSVEQIGHLVQEERSTLVHLVSEGTPRPLPTVVDVSAYRIVQEALTNVRKHAGPARVRVVLNYGPSALEIRVDDDGRARVPLDGSVLPFGGPANRVPGPGHGLTGMRERAALCGGELRAGPRPDGGWSVIARLPYDSPVRAGDIEGVSA